MASRAVRTLGHPAVRLKTKKAYIMKPKAGYDYLATAAHFAAESSTGTNVNVCTTDDFTKSVDALVYYIDPDSEEMSGLRSTSTPVTAGPCLDTGQMAAKLLEQGVVIDPGGADLVGFWFRLRLDNYDALADCCPMRGRRIGEASHPGPSGGGARATARKREEGHTGGDVGLGNGLLDILKPMIQQLIKEAFTELFRGDAMKDMVTGMLVGGVGPLAPARGSVAADGGNGKGGSVNRWQAARAGGRATTASPTAAPTKDPDTGWTLVTRGGRRAGKGNGKPDVSSSGKGKGKATTSKGPPAEQPAHEDVWTSQGRFVSLFDDKGKGKGKSKGKGKQDAATKGGGKLGDAKAKKDEQAAAPATAKSPTSRRATFGSTPS